MEVKYDKPVIGPNGLAYEDGTVYGVTDKDVFAIDAATGEETWKKAVVTGEFGVAEGQNLGLTIQPAIQDGVLYLSEAAKAGGGDLLALTRPTARSFGDSTPPTSRRVTRRPRGRVEHARTGP